MKIPSGNYIMLFSSGPYWYGEDLMFHSLGVYQKSETLEIKSAKYKHTFTLEAVDDGNTGIYQASPSEFRAE